jgi:hypothetical protein
VTLFKIANKADREKLLDAYDVMKVDAKKVRLSSACISTITDVLNDRMASRIFSHAKLVTLRK